MKKHLELHQANDKGGARGARMQKFSEWLRGNCAERQWRAGGPIKQATVQLLQLQLHSSANVRVSAH